MTEGIMAINDMLEGILASFLAVGLAEIGDKTQLSVLLLASRTNKYFQLLMEVFLAFLLADGFAILVGSWITTMVPIDTLKLVSAVIFVIFGTLILRGGAEEAEGKFASGNPFVSGFTLIFVSECGDKTQIASALFAAEYDPRLVLIGTMSALTLLSILAIYLGKFIPGSIDRKVITMAAGIAFILIGTSFALSALCTSAFAGFV